MSEPNLNEVREIILTAAMGATVYDVGLAAWTLARYLGFDPENVYFIHNERKFRASLTFEEIAASTRTSHPDPQRLSLQICKHELLNEEGICRTCGMDRRGI